MLKRFLQITTKIINISLSIYYWLATCITIFFRKILYPKQENICILLAEHFGDIVACEPLSRQLKTIYPKARIYWIVRKPYRELVDYNPEIDVVIEEYSVFYAMLMAWKNPFDSFYNCQLPDLRNYIYLRKNLQNPAAKALGITKFNYYNHGNLLEIFSKVGNLPLSKDAPKVYIPDSVITSINKLNLPKKYIVIHCHSNSLPREWQDEHWEKLIKDILSNTNYQIIEVGLKSALKITENGYQNFCGKFSLLETAEIIRRATYFIGIDSGPTHLANAVGTYGFLLFGKFAGFEGYMPYSGDYEKGVNVQFIAQEGKQCAELTYNYVWEKISKKII